MKSIFKKFCGFSFFALLLSSPHLQAMNNPPPIIDIPQDLDIDNRDHAARQSLCTRLSNRGTIIIIALKNKASGVKNSLGSLLSAAGNKIMRLPGAQTGAQVVRDYAPVLQANKTELLSSALIAITTTGLFQLTESRRVYHLMLLPVFSSLLGYCENKSVCRLWTKAFVPIIYSKLKHYELSLRKDLDWILLWLINLSTELEWPCNFKHFIDSGFVQWMVISPITMDLFFVKLKDFEMFENVLPSMMLYNLHPLIVAFANDSLWDKMAKRTVEQRTLLLDAIERSHEAHHELALDRQDRRRPLFAHLLIKMGADINPPNVKITPLQLATTTNQIDIVTSLLAHGAEVNGTTGNRPLNPLIEAILRNRPTIVKVLLQYGADQKQLFRLHNDNNIYSSLTYARFRGFEEIVSLLRDKRYEEYKKAGILDYLPNRDIVLLVIDYE